VNTRFFWLPLAVLTLLLGSSSLWLDSQIEGWLTSKYLGDLQETHLLFRGTIPFQESEEGLQAQIDTFNEAQNNKWTVVFDEKGKRIYPEKLNGLSGFEKITEERLKKLTSSGVHEHVLGSRPNRWFIRDERIKIKNSTYLVRIGFNGEELQETMGTARIIMAVTLGFLILVGLLLAQIGSYYTYRNLRKMLQQVRPIAKALAARPGLQTKNDEMVTIAKSVRRLAANMEETVAALADERDRFSTVLEGMDTGVMSLDQTHRVTMANPAAQRLLSRTDPLVDHNLMDVWQSPDIHELVEEAWNAGTSVREIEILTPTRRVLRVNGTANETDQTLVLVIDEITQLRALETIRKDFVANVSHELRTPVSVIQANAETLLGGALSDEKSAPLFLAAIMRNARRLGQLITDLLDLAQLESGNYRIKVEPMPLGALLDNVVESLSEKADSKGMELISKWEDNQTAWLDERAFTQVFSNFLDNAIKYTPDGGQIVIGSEVNDGIVRIHVEDNGPGIDPRHHHRLFERFYRVDTGRSRELGGTGLGLAIVKHLALSMGGRVGVESIEPHGSRFWLELPAGDQPHTALAQLEGMEIK